MSAALAAPFATIFLYMPYCAALHALARRALVPAGFVSGVPVYLLRDARSTHDAVAVGAGLHGFLLVSRAAREHPAWDLIGAHLASHVLHRDGLALAAGITFAGALCLWSPWALLPAGLALALYAKRCERRADRRAASAVASADAIEAYAGFIAEDGMAHRARIARWALAGLRRLGLASHPAPDERARRFRSNIQTLV
jgi:hypothetical protein